MKRAIVLVLSYPLKCLLSSAQGRAEELANECKCTKERTLGSGIYYYMMCMLFARNNHQHSISLALLLLRASPKHIHWLAILLLLLLLVVGW